MTFNKPLAWLARLFALSAMLLVAACGSGGNDGSTGAAVTTPTTPVVLTNFTAITVDDGPAALATGTDGYRDADIPFVTVTLCVPGSSTCQTIDHVQLDTGSVGLRIVQGVLNPGLLAALPSQQDANGNPVGECYGYVDGYAFGSVHTADFQIGGASVSKMPFAVIGDSGAFASAPATCTAGGGSAIATVKDLGANGILGIGNATTDCGVYCTRAGGYAAAIYYDCPATGCGTIITRAATAAATSTAAFEQLPNPIAAMSKDNNGTVITMPAVAAAGAASVTGTLYFGIGTETNNALNSGHVLTTTLSTDSNGGGLLTAKYGQQTLASSYVDSGSSAYFFTDASLPQCTRSDVTGFYCPTPSQNVAVTLVGSNAVTADASFTLNNAQTLYDSGNAALPGLGADPNAFSNFTPYSNSFAFGFPFFFGRSVYTAIEGRTAGTTQGPYVAF